MLKVKRCWKVIMATLIVSVLSFYANDAYSAKAKKYEGKVKKIELGDKPKTGKITIATEAGDMTFDVTDKTGVKIIDIDKASTKADIGSILSEEKDGADKADTAEIKSKDGVVAKKIVATTTRRMTFTREEVKKKTEELAQANLAAAEKSKLATENPGTIKGKIKVFARTSGDTIIYIEKVGDNNFPPVKKEHTPEIKPGSVGTKAAGSPREYPVMDQLNIAFTPHVLPVLKGAVVDFPNSDTVRHNVFSPDQTPGSEVKINLGTYPTGTIKAVDIPGTGTMDLLCNVHSEMSGFIVALDNPYFTVTDRKGNFTIENVPAGTYTLKTWHERYKGVSMDVTVEAGKVAELKLPSMKKKKM
ncbi:MAG: carboxypeptidase regulatory-like domain-containing protein [Candidatus Scalinduaceae bacterium]